MVGACTAELDTLCGLGLGLAFGFGVLRVVCRGLHDQNRVLGHVLPSFSKAALLRNIEVPSLALRKLKRLGTLGRQWVHVFHHL